MPTAEPKVIEPVEATATEASKKKRGRPKKASKPVEEKIQVKEVTPVEETQVKEEKKPREKTRPVEETIDLPIKKLTDKEKDNLIKYLEKVIDELNKKNIMLENSAESAFRRARDAEDKYGAMENYYLKSFKYINTQMEALYTSIGQVTKGAL